MVKACGEIVAEMMYAIENKKDINLNGLKARISRKNKLQNQPRLVDIISAIPEHQKASLLPQLKAKPVRTASGVRIDSVYSLYISHVTHNASKLTAHRSL